MSQITQQVVSTKQSDSTRQLKYDQTLIYMVDLVLRNGWKRTQNQNATDRKSQCRMKSSVNKRSQGMKSVRPGQLHGLFPGLSLDFATGFSTNVMVKLEVTRVSATPLTALLGLEQALITLLTTLLLVSTVYHYEG